MIRYAITESGGVGGLPVDVAHEDSDIVLPRIVVSVTGSGPHADVPRSTGIRDVQVEVVVEVAVDDTALSTVDEYAHTLETMLADVATVRTILNNPVRAGRPTEYFRLYDLNNVSAVLEREDSNGVTGVALTCVAGLHN